MSLAFLPAQQFSGAVLALFQAASPMSHMGAMMTVCALFGVLLFVALVEFVILEFLWIKVWRQRLRNESRTAPAVSGGVA